MGRHPSRRHTSPEDAPVGRKIRQRRRELDLTQAHLAGPEYTKSFISQLEGGYADPSLDTLRFLGRRLQMALSTMAGDVDDQRLATAGGLLAWAQGSLWARNHVAARRALEVALEIARASGWNLYTADATLMLAKLEIEAGNFDAAAAALDRVTGLAAGLGLRVAARKDLTAGLLALRRGDAAGAAIVFRGVLVQARKSTRHPDLAARALLGLAAALADLGDLRGARRRLEGAITLTSRARLDGLRGRAVMRLGILSRMEGAEDDALDRLTEACQILERAGDPKTRTEAEIRLGRLLLERGQAPEAIAPVRRALDLTRQIGDGQTETEALILLSRATLAAGDVALALRTADDAHTLADTLGVTTAKLRASCLRGRALLHQGRAAEAVRLLADAVTQLATGGPAGELAEAATALGQFHRSRGEHDQAAHYLEVAQEAARRVKRGDGWAAGPAV